MRKFTIFLSFILLIHLSDLSAQRSSSNKSGRKTAKKTSRKVVTTDSTSTNSDTTATNGRKKNKAIILCAIDNLIKGGSGQAMQNMNLLCGFNEQMGFK